MDEIALHIDFLLHSNDCVIIPGLGGFVVNVAKVERNGLWGIDIPTCELIFNYKLTYNDGLLAESLMKTNDISYESAIKKIKSACDELNRLLLKGDEVEWENLGVFKGVNENKPVFLPNKLYIRPQYYGLSNARLKPLSLISTNSNNKNSIPVKYFMQYISSGIAIAILFFFIVVSYNNNNSPKSQQAEIVSKSLIFNTNKSKSLSQKAQNLSNVQNKRANTDLEKVENQPAHAATDIENTMLQSKSVKNYYIIVGVFEVSDLAEKTLNSLKNKGFNTASILKRYGRLDVYSASFDDKKEAQKFLMKFKEENPRYKDAWLSYY
ncbi:MAG: SPOR domain-containing protein [Dysgonamonadaceae bacterium]|nr:SPOR domain-containing protein [Dysgonamonadaceae bacterium]MDD4727507.1 SPOR domain-containing protein [Dysgonamonadaceae bacterium]